MDGKVLMANEVLIMEFFDHGLARDFLSGKVSIKRLVESDILVMIEAAMMRHKFSYDIEILMKSVVEIVASICNRYYNEIDIDFNSYFNNEMGNDSKKDSYMGSLIINALCNTADHIICSEAIEVLSYVSMIPNYKYIGEK